MESVLFNTLIVSFSLLILSCVLSIVNDFWWRPKKIEKQLRNQGIKGNSYTFLYGDFKQYAKLTMAALSKPISLNDAIPPRVSAFYHHVIQNYGEISMCWMGKKPTLIVVEPETVRSILVDKNSEFHNVKVNPLVSLITKGMSSLEREKWAKRRKLITPAFHPGKIKGMVPSFSVSCSLLVEQWKKLVSAQGFIELDIAPELQNFSADVISRTAFGSSYEEGKKIFELQKEQLVLVLEASRSLYFPGLRFIPTKKNKRRYKVDSEIKGLIRATIRRKQHAMANGETTRCEDLLGMLVRSTEDAENEMSVEELIEECKLFYFAGQETTGITITWTILLLAMNPYWQDKAREEILQSCGNEVPDFESLNHLKIMSLILQEVLRLYPPVANMFRHNRKTVNIAGMTIPAGIDFIIPTLFLHYDPKYWGDDVLEFKPDRFSEGASKATLDHPAYYPFGWGKRMCPGQSFATIETKLALAMLLQNFRFEPSPSYVHAPYTILTLQPQHAVPIILHRL